MMRWEAMECVPTAVKHCKMVCVPKKDEYSLPPSAFRPIGILSSWWRGRSTAWISDKRITSWTKHLFPVEVAGGIAGSCGPDALAAVIGHELQRLGFGITLDFKHAFDSIDLAMMEQVMQSILPCHCERWSGLLFTMWKGMSRWVVYDSSVHHDCITSSFGLPQGDPASPLVMNLLMLAMKKTIDQRLAEDGSRFLHAIYIWTIEPLWQIEMRPSRKRNNSGLTFRNIFDFGKIPIKLKKSVQKRMEAALKCLAPSLAKQLTSKENKANFGKGLTKLCRHIRKSQ